MRTHEYQLLSLKKKQSNYHIDATRLPHESMQVLALSFLASVKGQGFWFLPKNSEK